MRADCPSAGFYPVWFNCRGYFYAEGWNILQLFIPDLCVPGVAGPGFLALAASRGRAAPAHRCRNEREREHLATAERLLFAPITITQ